MKRIGLFTLVVMFCLFGVPAAMAADTIPVGVPIPMTGWGQDVRAYGKYDAPFFADDGSQAAVDVFREDPKK